MNVLAGVAAGVVLCFAWWALLRYIIADEAEGLCEVIVAVILWCCGPGLGAVLGWVVYRHLAYIGGG